MPSGPVGIGDGFTIHPGEGAFVVGISEANPKLIAAKAIEEKLILGGAVDGDKIAAKGLGLCLGIGPAAGAAKGVLLVVEAKDSTFNVAEDLIVVAPSIKCVIAEPTLEPVAVAVAADGVVEAAADHVFKLADAERQRQRGCAVDHHLACGEVGGGVGRGCDAGAGKIDGVALEVAARDRFDVDQGVGAESPFLHRAEGAEGDGAAQSAVVNAVESNAAIDQVVAAAAEDDVIVVENRACIDLDNAAAQSEEFGKVVPKAWAGIYMSVILNIFEIIRLPIAPVGIGNGITIHPGEGAFVFGIGEANPEKFVAAKAVEEKLIFGGAVDGDKIAAKGLRLSLGIGPAARAA